MVKAELEVRIRRLLEGRAKAEDLDRLFLDQRETAYGNECFRELGDFLAHRDERNKGPVTQRVRDIFTSFRVWSFGFQGRHPSLDDLRAAGMANLNLLTDAELRIGLGTHREAAKTKLSKALRKIESGYQLSKSDENACNFLANRFVWKPAFTDDDLSEDFAAVCLRNKLLASEDRPRLNGVRTILTLHAITRLHGASIRIDDNRSGTLIAGYANNDGRLEVKIDLASGDWPKPVVAPICVFLTVLNAKEHCDADLLARANGLMWDQWDGPIELGEDGKLRSLG